MNFSRELHQVGLLHNCNTCIVSNCSHRGQPCNTYFPNNMNSFLSRVVSDIAINTPKSKDKKLIRRVGSDKNQTTCDGDTLDKYYVGFINDSLSQIRHPRGVAYVFHLTQIKDIMRFEDIDVKYNVEGDCFEVRKAVGV